MSGGSSSAGSDNESSIDPISAVRPNEDDSLDEGKAFTQGIFGVLYTVSKEKAPGWKWAFFRLFMDFLQLWLILVNPAYGYTGWINERDKLWQVVSLLNLTLFLKARGYTFFLAFMYIMAVGLVLAVGLCVWVANSFRNNRFDHVWPIVVLRIYSVVFFQVLDVATITLFMVTLDCQMYFTDQPIRGFHQEFPDVYCWAMPHMIHVAVGCISLLLFTVMAGAFCAAEMELNPLSKNPLAMSHSGVEVVGFVLKFIMTTAATLVLNLKWLSSIQAGCCLIMLWLYFKWVPHLHDEVNNIRVGTYACVFYCSLMLLFLGFMPAVDYNDETAVYEFQQSITYAMWAGLVPSFGLGYLASYLRQRWYREVVLQRFRDATAEDNVNHLYNFEDPREVEILTRCCRSMVEEDVVDDNDVQLAELVMKAGTMQMSSSAYMLILYSSFLIEVQSSYQSGYSILQTAKKQDPSFLERFAIFSREQQHAQKNSGSGQGADLVSYVEFQRNYRLALKVHKEALLSVKAFWTCLLQKSVKFDNMSTCVEAIEVAVKQADRVYRNVIQRHANSVEVVRLYAKFLEHVKHDPWSAAKWASEAEKLEQLAEEQQAGSVFEDLGYVDNALKGQHHLSDTRALVVMDAQCIIQAVNQVTCDLLGFSKTELVGRNINLVIPPPFADNHNKYVRNYIVTGKSLILNKDNNFCIVHKERYVIPVHLVVNKVSGIGEDTKFMGLIERIPIMPDVATMWVLFNGQLVCADRTFTNWCAFRNEEVVGTPLSNYVVDFVKLEKVLRTVRTAASINPGMSMTKKDGHVTDTNGMPTPFTSQQQTEWIVAGVNFAHKYSEPVLVDITVSIAGVGSHKFTKLSMRRSGSAPAHEMMVTDRKGRILHMTHDFAVSLGSTAKVLMAQDSKNALQGLLVQPFAQLHQTLGMHVPPHAPPPYSCRAGLSMLMSSVGPQGPDAAAFRMHVTRKQQGVENVWHVVSLEKRSIQQALGERCLTLHVDMDGYVIDVPGVTSSPFGFKPNKLLGSNIATFVDIMNVDKVVGPLQPGPPGRPPQAVKPFGPESEKHVGRLLSELAVKSLEAPGISWRCSVAVPSAGGVAPRAVAAHPNRRASVAVEALGKSKEKHGMMSVHLMMEEDGYQSVNPSRPTTASTTRGADGAASLGRANPSRAPSAAHLGMSAPVAKRGRVLGSICSADNNFASMCFEVKIWRAKLVTSLIEVDGAGKVVDRDPEDKVTKLYPAGVVLGASDEDLFGQPISSLLPLGPRGIRSLLDNGPVGPKSLLKGATATMDKTPGPVQILKAKHLGDLTDTQVTVQAIPKLGRSTHVYLLIHPHQPQGGRPDFAAWVFSGGLNPAGASRVDKHLEKQLSRRAMSATSSRQSSLNQLRTKPGLDLDRLEAQLLTGGTIDFTSTVDTREANTLPPANFFDSTGPAPAARARFSMDVTQAAPAKTGRASFAAEQTFVEATLPEAAAASDDESASDVSIQEQVEVSNNKGTDYRRGQRYKKLTKLLTSSLITRATTQYKLHATIVVVALLAAHFGVFILIYSILNKETEGVQDLNNAGLAMRFAGELGIISRQVEVLLDPIEAPFKITLKGFDTADDIPPKMDWYKTQIDSFKAKHEQFYLGSKGQGRQLPNLGGLREMWEQKTLDQAVFVAIPFNESIDFNHTVEMMTQQASLWDIGNNLVTAANQVLKNGPQYQLDHGHLHEFLYFQYLMNNIPDVFADNYYKTMDIMMEYVLERAKNVNQIQTILLASEGCVLCILTCAYLWLMSLKVASHRFSLYSVFVAIPFGLARSLATQQMDLNGDEEEDDDGGAGGAAPAAGAGGAVPAEKTPLLDSTPSAAVTFHVANSNPNQSNQPQAPRTAWQRIASVLSFARNDDPSSTSSSKRKLIQSYKQPLLLIWPFLLWGATIIATYAIGVTELSKISGPIATFNMVNFVTCRTHLFYLELQELVIEFDQDNMDKLRVRVGEKYELLKKDYTAMMYGGQALPDETSKHFTLATLGLTYSGGKAADILFKTHDCMCEDRTYCKEELDNIYYYDTHNGLSRLMNQFLKNSDAVKYMHGLDPWLFGPEFGWFYYVREDILGGLSQLNLYYQSYVIQVYGSVLTIHIAALVLTVLILLGFVFLVLRPFYSKTQFETTRIAELLSQLPPDVDVETLVVKVLPKTNNTALVEER